MYSPAIWISPVACAGSVIVQYGQPSDAKARS
jgi:hypothetical protein